MKFMRYFEAAGLEGVLTFVCLLNWIDSIKKGQFFDFATVMFVFMSFMIFRKFKLLNMVR